MNESSRFDPKLNNRGVALVTVLLVMLVLTILTTGVVVIAMNNYNQSNTTVDHNQAYYVAEAGINYQVKSFETKTNSMVSANKSTAEIDAGITTWVSDSQNVSQTFSTVNGVPSSFAATASRSGNNITISAAGTVGTVTRHLIKTITLTGFNITNAILTSGSMDLTKFNVIGAPVQTLSNAVNTVTVSGGTTYTQVNPIRIPTPPPGQTFLNVISGCDPNSSTTTISGGTCKTNTSSITIIYDNSILNLPDVVVPDTPPLSLINKLAQSTLVDISGNLEISSNTAMPLTTYNLDTSNTPNTIFYAPKITIAGTVSNFAIHTDSNIQIVTDTLDLGGSFTMTGKGTLTIFVPPQSGNGANAKGFINNCPNSVCGVKGDPIVANANKLIVVITGTSGPTFTFTQTGNGSIYLSMLTKSNMSLDLGGTGSFNGFVATAGSAVNIQGTGSLYALIYAPKATITTKGTGDVTGALIGQTFVNHNSTPPTITYYDFTNTNPFGFLSPYSNIGFNPTVEN